MMRALTTAATGMVAQQHNLDVISNNLANVNTTGFKAQRAQFEDLMYETIRGGGASQESAPVSPQYLEIGSGARISATTGVFTYGGLETTDDPLNMALSGNNTFFKLKDASGAPVYSRDGTFTKNPDGKIVNADGLFLDCDATIPDTATAVTVDAHGAVSAIVDGGNATKLGQVTVTNFANPAGLKRLGNNLFAATDASGAPNDGTPGAAGFSALTGGAVETSNVQVVTEMTRMITAQRAYEINSKAIQTADDMLSIVNNLKR